MGPEWVQNGPKLGTIGDRWGDGHSWRTCRKIRKVMKKGFEELVRNCRRIGQKWGRNAQELTRIGEGNFKEFEKRICQELSKNGPRMG